MAQPLLSVAYVAACGMGQLKARLPHAPFIFGRKTWESLPRRPLPGRINIVLTRDGSYEEIGAAKGALVCERFDEAVQIAREQAEEDGVEEFCVIGGAALFAMALPGWPTAMICWACRTMA